MLHDPSELLQDPQHLDGLGLDDLREPIGRLWTGGERELLQEASPGLAPEDRVHGGTTTREILYALYNGLVGI